MGSCCLWHCHYLHPLRSDLFGAARTCGLRQRLPSARTFPPAPDHCRPSNSKPVLKFTEHSLQCLGGAGNDSKGSPASGRGPSGPPRKGQNPQESGLRRQTRQAAARGPLPPGDRGNRGNRPQGSTPQPLSHPFAGLILTLATPPKPGLSPAPPRPRYCSRAPPRTCRGSLSTKLSATGWCALTRLERWPRMPSGRPRPAPSQRPRRRSTLLESTAGRTPSSGGASRALKASGSLWAGCPRGRLAVRVAYLRTELRCHLSQKLSLRPLQAGVRERRGRVPVPGAPAASWLCLFWTPHPLCPSRQLSQRRTTTNSLCKDAGARLSLFIGKYNSSILK